MCECRGGGKAKGTAGECRPPKDGDPNSCSPEQIRKCHGDVKAHPCAGRKSK